MQYEIYVELCEEAKKTVQDNNMCAKLRMSMHKTKAAAQNWQKKVHETMATPGFSIGKASPVLFCHPQRSVKCLVHGDDFVVPGEPVDLVRMRNELESKLELNTTTLGDESGMSKEVKIPNRNSVGMMKSGYPTKQIGNTQKQFIRETGASNVTSLNIPWRRESWESWA